MLLRLRRLPAPGSHSQASWLGCLGHCPCHSDRWACPGPVLRLLRSPWTPSPQPQARGKHRRVRACPGCPVPSSACPPPGGPLTATSASPGARVPGSALSLPSTAASGEDLGSNSLSMTFQRSGRLPEALGPSVCFSLPVPSSEAGALLPPRCPPQLSACRAPCPGDTNRPPVPGHL